MKNYDKSLLEVWEWKEKVYQDVKSLPAKEYVDKIRKDAEKLLSDSAIQLRPVILKKEHQNT